MHKNEIIKIKFCDFFSPRVTFRLLSIVIIKMPGYLSRNYKNIVQKRKNILFYEKNQENVNKLLNLVGDDLSREVILGQINFSKTFDFSYIRNIFKPSRPTYIENNTILDSDHYFSKDIIRLSDEEGFVNCGSYNGDTIKEFLSQTNGKFNHIFAFEPSKINFLALVETVKELKISSDKITCYQKGVYSESSRFNFSLNTEVSGGAAISKYGEEIIDVVKLDDFLSEDEKVIVTFINMDIEGAESEALKGMQEIIRKNKPKLAISVYHSPEHFWSIPFFIKSLNPNYKIYFRQHALSEAETVCYAV
jgi:FkbM family methyltransferase